MPDRSDWFSTALVPEVDSLEQHLNRPKIIDL